MAKRNFIKASDTNSRFKLQGDRARKTIDAGVPPELVAREYTERSPHGHTYAAEFAIQLRNFHEDCESVVMLTQKRAGQMIDIQHQIEAEGRVHESYDAFA